MTTLKYGDVIKNKAGTKLEVIGICGEVLFITPFGKNRLRESHYYTEAELRSLGYTWDVPKLTPKVGNLYYFPEITYNKAGATVWTNCIQDIYIQETIGIYPTEAEALTALADIKNKLSFTFN